VAKKVISTESPSKEQTSKRGFVSEDVDIKGLVRRNRVVDQTIFDAMLLMEMIDQSHHEAAHLFLDLLVKSGAMTSGINPDPGIRSPAYAIGNLMGDRRMAFSEPYRKVVSDCGDDDASMMMDIFGGTIYSYPESMEELGGLAKSMTCCLSSLSSYFGTSGVRDPRRVIRRQIGSWRK